MESYQRLIDVIALANWRMQAEHWVLTKVLVVSTLWQLAAVVAAFGLAAIVARLLRPWMRSRATGLQSAHPAKRGLAFAAFAETYPVLVLVALLVGLAIARLFGWPDLLLLTFANLLVAWIVIRLLSFLIRNEFWSRVSAVLVFAVATLNILGLLEVTIVRLDQIGIRMGSIHLSVLDVLRGGVQLAVLLWAALTVSRLLERRVQQAENLTPSLRVLTGKLLRFGLITLALVIALTSVGIDLTAFALFSGALGVGIGFGMQKSISNLISGLLLLFDRSIKPGDVLELSDPNNREVQLFGWVTALNARYVSLTTRDGTEWLVPNEELISTRIVNWSYSHNRLRLLTPLDVTFDCDVALAMQLAEEVMRGTPRVLADPPPVCRLMGFSDSTANLEMRFWIDDPANGIINVRSDVLLGIWKMYRKHGIRTPLGYRDLHIAEGSELTVRMKRASEATPP